MDKLNIITVIPISRGIFRENLTYFTAKPVCLGSIVVIKVRNKSILGMVSAIVPAEEAKADIKNAEFDLKKIERVLSDEIFRPEFMTACQGAANFLAGTTGQLVRLFTPQGVLADLAGGLNKQSLTNESPAPIGAVAEKHHEVQVLQLEDAERLPQYKSIIREEFAKKRSILFILPTVHDVLRVSEILKKGIEEYTVTLHGRMTKKNLLASWKKATEDPHPLFIVATPIFLSVPRKDLSAIVVDKTNSRFYKLPGRPNADVRSFAVTLAREYGIKIILGDSILRLEDVWQSEAGSYMLTSPLKHRFTTSASQNIVDMRKPTTVTPGRVTIAHEPLISPDLFAGIKEAQEHNESFLLISTRKGLGTSTICQDCGEVVLCPKCECPLTLYRQAGTNIFSCGRCLTKSSTEIMCKRCNGWKLKALGVGTEMVEAEIAKKFPQAKLFVLDGRTADSYKKGLQIVHDFYKTRGAILIATEMALNYISEPLPNVAVVSIDSLFSIPDFRINEKIFNLLMRYRFMAEKSFIIQTRRPEEKIFAFVLRGDFSEFYKKEITERKRFNYPPFARLIKITMEGAEAETNREMAELGTFLNKYNPSVFPSFAGKIGNNVRINLLMKLPPESWPPRGEDGLARAPYNNLLEILKSLPPRFETKVDPEDIL